MVTAPARRRQVDYAKSRGLPLRRACALLGTARSGLRHQSKRAKADAPVLAQMRELASQYPRYGDRMIQLLLARQDTRMSPDRAYRLWRSVGLQVPRKRPRRRLAGARPRPNPANGPNHVWAIDFVFDTLADGRSLECLTVVDEWPRECLAIEVGSGIRAARVVEVLARLVSLRGVPRFLRSDNGPSSSLGLCCAGSSKGIQMSSSSAGPHGMLDAHAKPHAVVELVRRLFRKPYSSSRSRQRPPCSDLGVQSSSTE
jgi:putative transposase